MTVEKDAQLCIVVVNYKTPMLTLDCLKSLRLEIDSLDVIVLVVDNYSQDDSVEKIGEWIDSNQLHSSFRIIVSEFNGGFSNGNNIGIRAVKADFYLLLNSDTLVRANAIKRLYETANENPDTGIVGVRLEWPDGLAQESCFHFHTPISEFTNAACIGLLTKLFDRFTVPRPVVETIAFYDWVSFACVLIRKDVFEDIGLLDDKFFMYFEDVEFCYRAKKSGWKVMYQPASRVVHLRGGSSPLKTQAKLKKRLPRYFYESRARYFYLLFGRTGLFAANIAWSIGACISEGRALISKNYMGHVAKKQWRDIWINFKSPTAPYIHPKDYD